MINTVLDWLGPIAKWAGIGVGFIFLGFVLVWIASGVWTLGKLFTYDLWMHHKYTVHGYCPERGCHAKGYWVGETSDQMYGSSTVKHLACPNGHGSIPVGDRHGVEWAGF